MLVVDSPGGLVADSHQIYHKLKEVRTKRNMPVYVSMGRMAASGGYYVAMGAGPDGKIYAEPTTWTGSIGVIIPRYDVSKLASDYGVRAEPLTTGPYKDALNPFREMRPMSGRLGAIMDDAFVRFQEVILDGREKQLDAEQVKALATGQVYTAKQAEENKLIDVIGYLDNAIDDLKAHSSSRKCTSSGTSMRCRCRKCCSAAHKHASRAIRFANCWTPASHARCTSAAGTPGLSSADPASGAASARRSSQGWHSFEEAVCRRHRKPQDRRPGGKAASFLN